MPPFELAPLNLILVAVYIVFLLFFLPSHIYTIPEFLEKRFDARSRFYFWGTNQFMVQRVLGAGRMRTK